MARNLSLFESIVRQSSGASTVATATVVAVPEHPFDERGVYPRLPGVVRKLFDDGHFSQASFEAFKFLDKEVQRLAGSNESGVKLMMSAFGGSSPLIRVNALKNQSDKDEQEGYKFMFAGAMLGIRNPRGHEYAVADDPDECLDHLALASLLLRRLAAIDQASSTVACPAPPQRPATTDSLLTPQGTPVQQTRRGLMSPKSRTGAGGTQSDK